MLEAVKGLKKADSRRLNVRKSAIVIAVRFDSGLKGQSPRGAVDEELSGLNRLRNYEVVEEVVRGGVPEAVAGEIYQISIEEEWKSEELIAVLKGLKKAIDRGLTVEKAALAMIIRIAQGLDVPAEKMVEEELTCIAKLKEERERSKIIKSSPGVQKQIQKPEAAAKSGTLVVNKDLLKKSILSFYNAPTRYRWGGTSRGPRGVDCSGLTLVCYGEQGIFLPRRSKAQYRWVSEHGKTVSKAELRFGDLVFFSSNGWGSVTHVGIYYGDGNFVHASSSKGVTFTPLNERYYVRRFTGAGRIAD